MDSQCTQPAQLHPWNIFGHWAIAAKFSSSGHWLASNSHMVPLFVCHDDWGRSYQLELVCSARITSAATLWASPRLKSRRITLSENMAKVRTEDSAK